MASTSKQATSIENLITKLTEECEKEALRSDLVLPVIAFDSVESYLDVTHATSYTLKKRVSLNGLIRSFVQEVKQMQTSYIESIQTAFKTLRENYTKCEEMDIQLGEFQDSELNDDNTDINIVETLKDGTPKLKCIVGSCKTSTYKLWRHLTDLHKDLSDNQRKFAVQMAREISRNRKPVLPRSKLCEKARRNLPSSTKLVSRKYNYKKCILCSGLYMNLSDHIYKTHNISRTSKEYEHYVKSPKVIPKIFTKLVGNKRVEMEGKELEDAVKEHGTEVREQRNTLESLKSSREEIQAIREEMKSAENKEVFEELKQKLSMAQDLYISQRYKDTRKYNPTMKSWYNCYLNHLSDKGCKEPKRIVRMAMDVLICYQKKMSTEVNFAHLMDARFVRQIVRNFRVTFTISYASKSKYVLEFQKLLNFLILDVESPERKDCSQFATRSFIFEEIKNVLSNEMEILNKLKGKEMIGTKRRAKKKLLSEEELRDLMSETTRYISGVNSDIVNKAHLEYSDAEILKVRNSLIAVATVRIGRRSKEMTLMTLREVEEAEVTMVGDQKFHIINVAEQKNSRSGKPAPVAYSDVEFAVLKAFISDMRTKLTDYKFCDIVFPASSKITSHVDQNLSLSAAFKILQKYETSTGKKISSRSIRGSKVTISRQKNLPNSTLDHMAKAMNHKRSTADGFYDFNSLDISVRETLLSQSSSQNSSTPVKDLPPPNASSSFLLEQSSPLLENESYSDSSIDRGEKESTVSESEDAPANETIKYLRNKKIRKCIELTVDETVQLRSKIILAIDKLKSSNEFRLLKNSKGTICITPITKLIPEARNISVKKMRSIISELI